MLSRGTLPFASAVDSMVNVDSMDGLLLEFKELRSSRFEIISRKQDKNLAVENTVIVIQITILFHQATIITKRLKIMCSYEIYIIKKQALNNKGVWWKNYF